MGRLRAPLAWLALVVTISVPLGVAAGSDYLAYRGPVYIVAGFAGIVALACLLVQPLLVAGVMPGVPRRIGRRWHRWSGALLMAAVAVHVGGLWITSPPDMIDALTFGAPTAFSAFGVVAMWALVVAALLAVARRSPGLRPQVWRLAHGSAVAVAVAASVPHALLIEGTMGTLSKAALCVAVVAALVWVLARLKPWTGVTRSRSGPTGR